MTLFQKRHEAGTPLRNIIPNLWDSTLAEIHKQENDMPIPLPTTSRRNEVDSRFLISKLARRQDWRLEIGDFRERETFSYALKLGARFELSLRLLIPGVAIARPRLMSKEYKASHCCTLARTRGINHKLPYTQRSNGRSDLTSIKEPQQPLAADAFPGQSWHNSF